MILDEIMALQLPKYAEVLDLTSNASSKIIN